MSYDFRQLSWRDLEKLARDLLQADWGVTLESFKPGRDGGVDLRYAKGRDALVVQCKHYVESGVGELLRKLRAEKEKVLRLAPKRYVVVTTVPLSPADKDRIVTTMGESVIAVADVIGAEDLNNLLGRHPEVEQRHFKLWLASRAVLDRVLHNAALTRSEFKVRQVYKDARRYVQSEAYPEAMRKLVEDGVVVLAGPPGVGKTTLANLLLYTQLEKGYQAVVLQDAVKEGFELFQRGIDQVFYLDDFLGATFLGDDPTVIGGNRDQALVDFFRAVSSTPGKCLIVTTREHLLSQAYEMSERLRDANLDEYRVVLRMRNYSLEQRAEILYNHLYFGDLPAAHLEQILDDEFYLTIVKHRMFNPRIVEWLSSLERVRNVAVEDYRDFVRGLLEDPSRIWRHAYDHQISDAGRSMLLTLFSFGGGAAAEAVETAYARLHAERCRRYGIQRRPQDFGTALRELTGVFVTLGDEDRVGVLDPSVLDILNAVVRDAADNAVDIVAGACRFEQVARVWGLSKGAKGGAIVRRLAAESDRLASNISECAVTEATSVGGWGWRRWESLEGRFVMVADMADCMPDTAIGRLIEPLMSRMEEAWEGRGPGFEEACGVLRALEGNRSLTGRQVEAWTRVVRVALLRGMEDGCFSGELVGIASMLEEFEEPSAARDAVCSAFEEYEDQLFEQELTECYSPQDLDELVVRLQDVAFIIGVQVGSLIDKVEEAREEFAARGWGRAHRRYVPGNDGREDPARGSMGGAGEDQVRDMFGTLRAGK